MIIRPDDFQLLFFKSFQNVKLHYGIENLAYLDFEEYSKKPKKVTKNAIFEQILFTLDLHCI